MTEQAINGEKTVEQAVPSAKSNTTQKSARATPIDWMEQLQQERQQAKERWQTTKKDRKPSILNRLTNHGIKEVVVHYSGSGDSGSIEEIEITDPKEKGNVLDEAYQSARNSGEWEDGEWVNPDFSDVEQLAADIDGFCSAELEHMVGGWEVDDGSDGTFTFDVEAGTVTCSHDQYYRKSHNQTWEV